MNGARAKETVQKLWGASRSLQGGGVSYYEYITELTYLLLLKMLEEVKRDGKPLEERLPATYRWHEMVRLKDEKRLTHYRKILLDLGDKKKVAFDLVNQIYKGAKTSLTKASALATLVNAIDEVDWYAAEEDGLGDLYEGLLEKTTSEQKSKFGQYFTPRPLIDTIIEIVKPAAGKSIQDPAAGTGGFIIAAHRAILAATDELKVLTEREASFQKSGAYEGAELITGTHRLNTMNLLLHGIETPLKCIDTLSPDGEHFKPADLVLTNPPFNKFPERVTRSDFSITAGAAKGPLPFVEHVVRALKVGGRAAIVVPDNVLFEDNMGRQLRAWLMGQCDLHTILRLPTGIFYAQTREDFTPFVAAFGADPEGKAPGQTKVNPVDSVPSTAPTSQSATTISTFLGCAASRLRPKRPWPSPRTSPRLSSTIFGLQPAKSKPLLTN
jgi:type I restriction enzyme M protein